MEGVREGKSWGWGGGIGWVKGYAKSDSLNCLSIYLCFSHKCYLRARESELLKHRRKSSRKSLCALLFTINWGVTHDNYILKY
jgi:hypothetical protein